MDGSNYMYYLLGLFISFIIGVFITRWIFGIDEIIKSLKTQNELMKALLLKNGVTAEELKNIIE